MLVISWVKTSFQFSDFGYNTQFLNDCAIKNSMRAFNQLRYVARGNGGSSIQGAELKAFRGCIPMLHGCEGRWKRMTVGEVEV